ncbi:MAG: hypothetical protein ACRD3P_01365, partial [Terriglobales bacterium]
MILQFVDSVRSCRKRLLTIAAFASTILLLTGGLLAQTVPDTPMPQVNTGTQDPPQAKKDPKQNDPKEDQSDEPNSSASGDSTQSKERQTKRMMWVVPNFAAVSAGAQLPALTTREKFRLAEDDSFDYSAFVWTGILAFQSWALNSDPELGQGAAGYGRYYWRGFADGVSGTYFTEAIVPALTHEDPRYYTMGTGGFLRRTEYALSRTFLTKTDSGGTSFNWSEVGGNALEAGLSNAYYPPQEQGFNQTLRNWGTQMESAAVNN